MQTVDVESHGNNGDGEKPCKDLGGISRSTLECSAHLWYNIVDQITSRVILVAGSSDLGLALGCLFIHFGTVLRDVVSIVVVVIVGVVTADAGCKKSVS